MGLPPGVRVSELAGHALADESQRRGVTAGRGGLDPRRHRSCHQRTVDRISLRWGRPLGVGDHPDPPGRLLDVANGGSQVKPLPAHVRHVLDATTGPAKSQSTNATGARPDGLGRYTVLPGARSWWHTTSSGPARSVPAVTS